MLPEILIYPALLAVYTEDRLIRHTTRNTPTEAAGCCAECDEWNGWGL